MAGRSRLPQDVLEQAATRVVVLTVVGVVFFGVALALLLLQPAPDRQGLGMLPVALSGLLGSILTLCLLKFGGFAAERRLHLGLLYHVAMGFQIAWLELPRISGEEVLLNGLSSLAVWQLLFPGLVPTTRRHLGAAAVLIAGAVPGVALLASLTGRVVDWGAVVVSALPVAVGGAVGVAIGQVVYGLSQKLQEARDVGSYRLLEKLGKGGMGEVWRAEHRLLARPAAVKLIKPELIRKAEDSQSGEEDPRVLFEREAGVIARLRSPHTVELYDYGVREDGLFFYVMELLDGFDLHRLVTSYGPVDVPRTLHVLHGLCLSLAEAHDAGLVHRDVKPANVFLTKLGTSADVVKVLDFGLVLTEEMPTSVEPSENATGTPQAMAPEVVYGHTATPRSDLYAVGCVAHWLLTGSLPFDGPSIPQLLFAHANLQPPKLSLKSPYSIPQELQDLVDSCLAKDQEARPASASGLARDLEKVAGFGVWTATHADHWWEQVAGK